MGVAIKCPTCGEQIRSEHSRDFKYCKCGDTFVDGGNEYLRWGSRRWKEVEWFDEREGEWKRFNNLKDHEERDN